MLHEDKEIDQVRGRHKIQEIRNLMRGSRGGRIKDREREGRKAYVQRH